MPETTPFKRVLITGINGSAGSYLAEYIIEKHPTVEVHGMSRWHSTAVPNIAEDMRSKAINHECDLTDFSSVFSVISRVQPDAICHIASHANVLASFSTPLAVLHNNIMGTANLFEAVRLSKTSPIILLCSTSEVYGQVDPKDIPITEECPTKPSSPYAVSKASQDLLAWTYFRSYGMKIIRTRMFTYINPKRSDLFATSFARQIARIEEGLQQELVYGNLDSVRTIIDVRDAMDSYWNALVYCVPGEVYNIGGTVSMTVGDFLKLLIEKARIPIKTRQDAQLLRPADVTLQIPNVEKFARKTGWKARHSVESSVDLLLAYWRKKAAEEKRNGEIPC